MRLWSLHPRYLDVKGLVALWREGLLAQAVLAGQTRGYKHHPQLARFLDTPAPRKYIAAYLRVVCDEAARRGYNFDASKIGRAGKCETIPVTTGQLKYEWEHLQGKLTRRDPDWLVGLGKLNAPELHPLFHRVAGKIADWERTGD